MDVDDVFLELGKFGKFQMRTFFMCSLTSIHLAMHMLAITFHGMEPIYHCTLPGENFTSTILDQPTLHILNFSLPQVIDDKTGERTFSQCTKYYNSSRVQVVPCDNWMFYRTRERFTIVEQWSLVCEDSRMRSVSGVASIFMFGVMFGSFGVTQLADLFGRKPVMLASLWIQACLDIIVAFVPSFIPFTCLYFFIGVLQSGHGLPSFVLGCEYLHKSIRVYGTVIGGILWAIGLLMLVFFAYFITYWPYLQITIAACNLATIPYLWFLPESIHWLISKNRNDEAQAIVCHAAKVNGCELIPNLKSVDSAPLTQRKDDNDHMPGTNRHSVNLEMVLSPTNSKQDNSHKSKLAQSPTERSKRMKIYTIISIFRNRTLLPRMLMLCLIWFTNSLVYYGLTMYTPSLSGDFYINFMINALVEIPGYLVALGVLKWGRRRHALMGFHIVVGISLLVIMFIPQRAASGADLTKLTATLSFIGKFGISGSFLTIFLYGAEVYPTVVRNIGIGWNGVWARIGGVLAPFSQDLAEISPFLIPTIFGTLSLLCAVLTLFMPETAKCPLPEIMQDVPKLTLRELMCNGGLKKTEEKPKT